MGKRLIDGGAAAGAINEASAREKSIRHGHPWTLHHWWARRPLAAARAVIFAQMVLTIPRLMWRRSCVILPRSGPRPGS